MKRFLMILTLLAFLGLRASGLEVGAELPATAVSNEAGETVDLKASAGKGYTLVYFYPKADTPGCTAQACSLRDAYETLQEKGVTIYGASFDDVEAQQAFRKKYQLPFHLLADTEGKLAGAFDVPQIKGFAKRQAFLFKDGVLIWKDASASTAQQAADVLAVLDGEKGK